MQTVKTSTFFMHWHYPQSILVLCISVSHRPQASLCAALQSQAWPATAAREFTFPKRTKYSCESRGSYRPAGRLWCIPHLPPVWTTSPEWTTSTHQTQATGRCPQCTHLNTCFRYVHILSSAQLLLNVFIWRHCGDLQCAVATWTLWTLCTLFDGDSSNSRDTLDTAVDNGLQCESWLFCALAKIFCKNHSGNPHSKASAPNTNWRLQMEKASLPPSWYFREVVRKNLLFGQLASWPDRINVYPSWNEKITKNVPI